MIKGVVIAILLGLCGFALGGGLARLEGEGGGPGQNLEPPAPPALRHSSQLRPPPEPAGAKPAQPSGR